MTVSPRFHAMGNERLRISEGYDILCVDLKPVGHNERYRCDDQEADGRLLK